ncbi:TonB-dependent receptor [Trichlorobacter sp.]|uniref:TonB-dependent receptor plug domain-containing protein n=1 Tax=Trichlorobacter sp. TaxID=2911007 RepID=UPI002A35B0FB|nr:TonB-dependent receptor [Trichlorobacter sp.]MDY0383778.1 TonB-dependent receptor [Trichlorobacter sp.]
MGDHSGYKWLTATQGRLMLAGCCLGLALVAPAQAADDQLAQATELFSSSLDDLLSVPVSGASKFDQPISEAPSSISVVTAETIKLFGYRTLADLLRAQRGFFVSNDRNYSYVGVRGFGRSGDYNSRLLVLVDGHRINESSYDSALMGEDFILDLDLVERVEIIRGPASSLYGNSAFFGVINVITRHGTGLRGMELAGSAGGFESYKGRISYGTRLDNDLALSVSGSYHDSAGDRSLYYPAFDDPATNNGVARNLDGERSNSLFATASWRDLTLQAAYANRRKDIPTASYGVDFNARPDFTNDRYAYVNLKYEHAFPADLWLQARLYYDYYDYYGEGIYSGVLNRDESTSNRVGTELQASKLLGGSHLLIAGAGFSYSSTSFTNYDQDPFSSYLDLRNNAVNWSAFLQDEYTILPELILNAGLRFDHYEQFGGQVNPRLALIYTPLAQSTIKLIYGEAFRAPNNYELYYTAAGLGLKANPNLKPETIRTYELIYEQRLFDNYRLTLSGFYNKISDMVSVVADPSDPTLDSFDNISSASVRGAEAELEAKWRSGFSGRISYSYQQAKDDQTGLRLVNSPQHSAKANLVLPLVGDQLLSGIELQYLGNRRTLAGNRAGDQLITNLTLFSQKWIKGLECSLSLYNLFDQRYDDPASSDHAMDSIRQDGFGWRFKAVYSF